MHEAFSPYAVAQVIETMMDTPRHTYVVLTKRPERLSNFSWPDNAWLGVTVENQQRADERIPILLDTPAAVRFVCCEPLLGPVDLRGLLADCDRRPISTLDLVIVGGETGPGARPMHPEWALDLYRQAKAAGVPFWWKSGGPGFEGRLQQSPVNYTAALAMQRTRELPSAP